MTLIDIWKRFFFLCPVRSNSIFKWSKFCKR